VDAATSEAPISLEVRAELLEGDELGRADEGEIARIEEEHEPAAPVLRQAKRLRAAHAADVGLERRVRSGGADLDVH